VTDVGTPTGMASSASIGTEGGQLVSADGRLTLIVPPSAVSAPTPFSIQPITNHAPGGVGDAYRITPDGQKFTTPATLLFTYGDTDLLGTSADSFDIAYQDPATHTWLSYDAVDLDTSARHVQVQTAHLTDWAMLDGYNLRPTNQHVQLGGKVQFSIVLCTTTGNPIALAGGGTVSGVQACKELGAGPANVDDDLLTAPQPFKNWSVNGAPGGTNGTGLVAATDSYHATYTAPAMKPSMNPVNVSAQTISHRNVTTVTALVYIDASAYHVEAHYAAINTPVCNLATGNMTDQFALDLDVTMQSVTNIQNDVTMVSGTQAMLGGMNLTLDSPPEEMTIHGLMDIQAGPGAAHTVVLDGQRKPGACTVYFGGSPVKDPGSPVMTQYLRFVVDDSKFDASGKQTVTADLPGWTVTITKN
jgi:hypothetical protein